MSHGIQRRSRRAFTLVELLVALSVVMVLIGLFFPAIAGARARAQSVRCQVNLRGSAAAVQLYSVDHRALPVASRLMHTQLNRTELADAFTELLPDSPAMIVGQRFAGMLHCPSSDRMASDPARGSYAYQAANTMYDLTEPAWMGDPYHVPTNPLAGAAALLWYDWRSDAELIMDAVPFHDPSSTGIGTRRGQNIARMDGSVVQGR